MFDFLIFRKHCISFTYRGFSVLSILWLGAILGGCATTTMQVTESLPEQPLKILVMQSPMSIGKERLNKIFAPDSKQELSSSDEPITHGIQHAQNYASETMSSDLAKLPKINIVTPTTEEKRILDNIRSQPFGAPISQKEANDIRKITGADALLKYQITDYGLTPKSWKKGYITFEVVTTLGFAAIIAYAGSHVAKAAAGVYLEQETAEETAEAYAGFWALDEVYRPVRVRAELVQLNPIKTLWKGRDTGLSDRRLSRLMRKVGKSERDKQLNQSTDDAVNHIITAFSDYLNEMKLVKTDN